MTSTFPGLGNKKRLSGVYGGEARARGDLHQRDVFNHVKSFLGHFESVFISNYSCVRNYM